MSKSDIISQVVKIEKSNMISATHFALYNGSELRYLIDINGGKKRLSKNISTYSKNLSLLMKFINIFPLSLFKLLGLGNFVKTNLHPAIDECRKKEQKKHWNMIIGTYDEKQKVVLQCFNQNEIADFVKVGNASTEDEMNTEISFLQKNKKYKSFEIPQLLSSKRRAKSSIFNIQVTKEFCGNKVKPEINQEIIAIYQELSKDIRNGLEFSHGDFAPWNLKKYNGRYTLFDWEHCGYRMPGFDIMHYATIIEIVIKGKDFPEAFELGIANIRKYFPTFDIDKGKFLEEFSKLRTQIS